MCYSLIHLTNESYKVNYRTIKNTFQKFDEDFNLSACFYIPEVQKVMHKRNESLATYMRVSDVLSESFKFFEKIFYENGGKQMPIRFAESFSVINSVCYIVDQRLYSNLKIFHDENMNIKLFVNSQSINYTHPHFVFLIRNTTVFHLIRISKTVSEYMGKPYDDCEAKWTDKYQKNYTTYSRFECFNNCLKRKKKYFLYLYKNDEHDYLNFSEIYFNKKDKVDCLKECQKFNCLLETYMAVRNDKFETIVNHGLAFPVIINIHFCLQVDDFIHLFFKFINRFFFAIKFLGLIALFLNISVNETFPYLLDASTSHINQKFKKSKEKFEKIFYHLKIALTIINLATLTFISSLLIIDYISQVRNPIYSTVSNFEYLESISVIICVPVKFLIAFDYQNLTYHELEYLTNDINHKFIKNIYLSYGSQENEIDYFYSSKVYFKNDEFESYNGTRFSRCFRIEVSKKEALYRSLLTIGVLVIELKGIESYKINIYVVEKNDEFNSNQKCVDRRFKILKLVTTLSEESKDSNCFYYSSLNLKCKSRTSCLSACRLENYLEIHDKLLSNELIDKDLLDRPISNYNFTDHRDEEIYTKCLNKYKKNDCKMTNFLPSFKSQMMYDDRIEINLMWENVAIKYYDYEIGKLLINILNIGDIFFGLNLIRLSKTFFLVLRRVRILSIDFNGMYQKVIFVICSFGFILHSFVIFRDIIFSDLFCSGYFTNTANNQLPDLCFCFTYDQSKIQPDYLLTGKYLDELTGHIKFETIFKQIFYISENKENVFFNMTNYKESADFEFSIFFYLEMKCLVISPKLLFSEADFLFERHMYPIKIFLTDYAKNQTIFFISKKKDSKEMNEIYKFIFKEDELHTNKYLVNIVSIKLKSNDLFKYIKSPLNLIIGETDTSKISEYLKNMEYITKTKYGFLTTYFPLGSQNFKYIVDNILFNQYYYQVQKPIDLYYPINENYEREIYNTYVQISTVINEDSQPEIEFAPSNNIQQTVCKSANNYATLIQSILNSASLWLNVCILDAHIYISKLVYLFKFCYKKLHLLKSSFHLGLV